MINCTCGCGKEFPKFDSKHRPRKFISGHNSRTNNPHISKNKLSAICKICGREFQYYPTKTRGLFCSKQCQYIGFRGTNNPNFTKGYTIGRNGYICESNPSHPLADNKGRVLQHRRVAYDYLGFLPDNVIIHHINGNRLDNSIKNLALWTQGDHMKNHDPLSGRYHKTTTFAKPAGKPIPIISCLSAIRV